MRAIDARRVLLSGGLRQYYCTTARTTVAVPGLSARIFHCHTNGIGRLPGW
jgi:hypothetical protein